MSEQDLLREVNLLRSLLHAWTDDNSWIMVMEITMPDGITYRFSI